ncbi:MAG TPA: hypothetical protein VGI96_46245 [Streptosporangiaceae bacterium]|jgi:hypothetical protein
MAGPGESPDVPPGEPLAEAPAELQVPPSVLRSWDQAEARLFPLVMAQPEVYELALGLVRRLLERLRETCPDLAALLAAHERGADLVADLAEDPVPGVRDAVIAAAACAMRYRELVALITVRRRLAALDRGRQDGHAWVVVEESGSPERAPYVPYHRIEAEVGSGRAVIVSIGPDETLSRAVYRLDAGQLDVASGALSIGDEIGTYLDPGELAAALRQVRGSTA